MNRIAILQEMGVTSWVSRQEVDHTSLSIELAARDEPKVVESGVLNKVQGNVETKIETKIETKPVGGAPEVAKPEEDYVHEVDLANALEMRWVLVWDSSPESLPIFSKINRAIEDLGAKCQIFDLASGGLTPKDIQGDIVLAFGQKAGVLLSGERDSIENLREIVFEMQNRDGEDVPLVVTHHPRDLLKQPSLKRLVWDDILWARSIWLESRL